MFAFCKYENAEYIVSLIENVTMNKKLIPVINIVTNYSSCQHSASILIPIMWKNYFYPNYCHSVVDGLDKYITVSSICQQHLSPLSVSQTFLICCLEMPQFPPCI